MSERQNEMNDTHRVKDINPFVCLTLKELASDVVFGGAPNGTGTFPFCRYSFCFRASHWT